MKKQLTIVCKECGRILAVKTYDEWKLNVLQVNPCRFCIDKAINVAIEATLTA